MTTPTPTTSYRLRRLSIYFMSGEAQTWTFNDDWTLNYSRRDVITLKKPTGVLGENEDYIEVRKVAVAHWRLTMWMETPATVDPNIPAPEEAPRDLDLL